MMNDVATVACFMLAAIFFVLWIASLFTSRRTVSSRTNSVARRMTREERSSVAVSLAGASFAFPFLFAVVAFFFALPIKFLSETGGLTGTQEIGLLGFMAALAFFMARGVYVWSRWREIENTVLNCPQCGYQLTGNVSGRCPECGKETEAPATS